jgi:hypothetical protein
VARAFDETKEKRKKMKRDILSEPDFPPFEKFIEAMPEPDLELTELGKKAQAASLAYAEAIDSRDLTRIGAAAAQRTETNLLFLKRLAIVTRCERTRIDNERAAVQRPGAVAKRDMHRAIDSGNAEAVESRLKAAERFAQQARPLHERLDACLQVLELCQARSQQYGSRLGPDGQFFPLLSTAMETAAAKAEKALKAKK